MEEELYPIVDTGLELMMEEVAPSLTKERQQDLEAVIREFPVVFRAKPGRTTLTQHEINLRR